MEARVMDKVYAFLMFVFACIGVWVTIEKWVLFRFIPGSRRYVFWTHTKGHIWRDSGGPLQASPLTDLLQDYYSEKEDGRVNHRNGPVTLHQDY
jgi:hypothetical protein